MERNNTLADKSLNPEYSAQPLERTIPNHFSRFTSNQNGEIIFDFDRCLVFMEEKGRDQFGDHFRIYPDDYQLIFKLLVYAIRDQRNAEKLNLSLSLNLNLNKGLMLSGPVGCGKTSLMKLIRLFLLPHESYVVKSCRDISFEFISKGFEIITKYSTPAPASDRPKEYCFDDLGTEQSLKYYGNECNIMAEILLSRYEWYISHGLKTHITTNLSAPEIENLYGNRVRSRMREMFNVIAFDKESKDKRK